MRKCIIDPNTHCRKKKEPTEIDCLCCILSRYEKDYGELLTLITIDLQVPLGIAGHIYQAMNAIFHDNIDYAAWVKKFHPELLSKPPDTAIIKKQMERFNRRTKGMIV